jgi:hypothetical protein
VKKEMAMKIDRKIFAGFIVGILLSLLAWITLLPCTPCVLAPLNVLMLLPVFVMEPFITVSLGKLVTAMLVPIVFWLWCLPVLRGCPTVPRRSYVLLLCMMAMAVSALIYGFRFGVQYQGLGYVIGVVVISIAWWSSLIVFALVALRFPSNNRNIVFHAMLFTWLAWYAFPYLGELP